MLAFLYSSVWLAKLSPLLPFHDGHKVLCLDICIGNIIQVIYSHGICIKREKIRTSFGEISLCTSRQKNLPEIVSFITLYDFAEDLDKFLTK